MPNRFLHNYHTTILPQLASLFPKGDFIALEALLHHKEASFNNPNTQRFLKAFQKLPSLEMGHSTQSDCIEINPSTALSDEYEVAIEEGLKGLIPWRKGPFKVSNTFVDSEWKSYLKWNRILPKIPSLKNQSILDIGCNSGYYMFKMLPESPKCVIGIDPQNIYFFQFQAIQRFIKDPRLFFLPLKSEELSSLKLTFDTVFCMGILYHRRNPIDFLVSLKPLLRTKKSVLILETLIIPGDSQHCLYPHPSYAKMPNVYFIPTLTVLNQWLQKAGFKQCQTLFVEPTTLDEQRTTPWINTESLNHFLDPQNPHLTCEGYPAPLRACIMTH